MVVIVLNNVVADVNHDGANKGFFENKNRGQSIVPSLGLNWSNCINDRIALKKRGGTSNIDIKRTIVIEKSSYMRRNELDFEIVAQGLRGKHWEGLDNIMMFLRSYKTINLRLKWSLLIIINEKWLIS